MTFLPLDPTSQPTLACVSAKGAISHAQSRLLSNIQLLLVFCAIFALLGLPTATNAQQLYDGNQNLPPFGSFSGSDFDIVSLQNGNLHITIPLLTVKQRGKDIAYKFVYDTPSYQKVWVPQPMPGHPKNGTWVFSRGGGYAGWYLSTPFGWTLGSPGVMETCGSQQYTVYNAFAVQDPDGGKHQVPILRGNTGVNTTCGDTLAGPALDGSGIWATATGPFSGTITLKDGTVVSSQTEDSNGNIASFGSDTVGRNLLAITTGSTITYTSPLGKKATGPSNTVWTYTDSSGHSQEYQLNYQLIDTEAYSANLGTDHGMQLIAGTMLIPSTLTLPNALTYQFAFVENSVGQMQQITLPTGGSISYTYQTGGTPPSLFCRSAPNSGPYPTGDCRAEVAQRTVNQPGAASATWKYNAGTVTDPYGNDEVHTYTNVMVGSLTSSGTVETQVQKYSGCAPTDSACGPAGTLLRTTVTAYTGETDDHFGVLVNIRPTSVTTTLDNGQVAQTQTDYETFTYQVNWGGGATLTATRLNTTAYREYDYGSPSAGPLLRQTTYTYLHTGNSNYINRNIVDRVLTKTILDGNSKQTALTTYEYDNYNHPNQPMTASGTVQHDAAYSTGFLYRGNVTATQQWRSTDGALLTTTNQYDDAGNVLSTIDPLGNKTTFDFTDSWKNSTCAPAGQGKAYRTKSTNALNQATSYTYDSCTGLVASTTDPNLQAVNTSHDMFGRVTNISYPDQGNDSYCYTDLGGATCTQSAAPFEVVETKVISSSPVVNEISTAVYDGLGRVSQTQLTSDPSGTDYTVTTYDSLGRKSSVYNPTRCNPPTTNCGESTWGVTSSQYDALNRVTSIAEPDGSAINTSYSGNCTTSTDEGGKARKSCIDGLGRMTGVWEDPGSSPHLNYETDYTYDALNNLVSVTQNGSNSGSARKRTFQYDSLSRLTSASNPESGTILYGYDADSNVITKTAPAPNQTGTATVTTSYGYDALNRITGKSYSDGTTPTVYFQYDTSENWGSPPFPQNNIIGRLSGSWIVSSQTPAAEIFSYDAMGRVLVNPQCTPSTCGTRSFMVYSTYDLAGNLTSTTTAAGTTISYGYNGASRLTAITSSLNDAQHPPTLYSVDASLGYYPNGAIRKASFGNGLTDALAFNSRLQPCRINVNSGGGYFSHCTDSVPSGNVLDFTMGYNAGSADNGNVASWSAVGNQTFSRSYVHDALNRIQSMSDSASGQSCKGLSWTVDAWGNLTAQTQTAGTSCYTFLAAVGTNNQLIGYQYDAAGNLTFDGSHHYSYDAENRIIQVDSGSTASYVYDANGNRVRKNTGPTWTEYSYGPNGSVQSEYTGTTWPTQAVQYVYAGNKLIAEYSNNTTEFVHPDHLGSTRLMTAVNQSVMENLDYLPFGLQVAGGSSTTHKFTGKERDAESGLDNFGARYMASTMGRFMSADPFTVTPGRVVDPQQLNLYAYVRNNPLRHIDPTGMLIDDAACKQDMKHCGKDWQKVQDIANQQDKNGNYLHPELHNELTTLQNDSRTFTIENSSLGAGTAGQFTITNFTADGKDFTKATLQLDFKQIKGISGVTGADLVPGFNKYQGLLDSPMYRLAETFGHEGAHGLFSIQNPAQAVGIQQLLNQRDSAMQGQRYPYPPDVMQKMQAADQALIPTERFAQQAEKIINGELQADKKKQ